MSQFVNYVLTLGQQAAPKFGYATLGLSLERYGIDQVIANVPGAVDPTAAESAAYSCGDLTPTEVQAGQTTPTCGVTNGSPPPPPPGAANSPPSTATPPPQARRRPLPPAQRPAAAAGSSGRRPEEREAESIPRSRWPGRRRWRRRELIALPVLVFGVSLLAAGGSGAAACNVQGEVGDPR